MEYKKDYFYLDRGKKVTCLVRCGGLDLESGDLPRDILVPFDEIQKEYPRLKDSNNFNQAEISKLVIEVEIEGITVKCLPFNSFTTLVTLLLVKSLREEYLIKEFSQILDRSILLQLHSKDPKYFIN